MSHAYQFFIHHYKFLAKRKIFAKESLIHYTLLWEYFL